MSDLSCPTCGSELDLAVLFAHEQDQRALARLNLSKKAAAEETAQSCLALLEKIQRP